MKPQGLEDIHKRIIKDETLNDREKGLATFLICREIYLLLDNSSRFTTDEKETLLEISEYIYEAALPIINDINHLTYDKLRGIHKALIKGEIKSISQLTTITKAFYKAAHIHLTLDDQNNSYEKFYQLISDNKLQGHIHLATPDRIITLIVKIIKQIQTTINQVNSQD